jgi:hypothetical protein
MRKSKLMNWVVKPAMDEGYGHYSTGLTITEFYEKNFSFKKIVDISTVTLTVSHDYQAWYTANYDGTPYPMTNYYPWYSPLVIFAVDEDDNFWTFDSFWNNTVNWTDYSGGTVTLPDVDDDTAVLDFLNTNWEPYV